MAPTAGRAGADGGRRRRGLRLPHPLRPERHRRDLGRAARPRRPRRRRGQLHDDPRGARAQFGPRDSAAQFFARSPPTRPRSSQVDLDDAHTFLGSSNMRDREGARAVDSGKLSFVDAFSGGEYANQYYTGRRVWDGYAASPPPRSSRDVQGPQEGPAVPGDGEVDAKMSVRDWFAARGSHYEGTPYDTTKGLAAGRSGAGPVHRARDGGRPAAARGSAPSASFGRRRRGWRRQEDAAAGGVAWYAPAASSSRCSCR